MAHAHIDQFRVGQTTWNRTESSGSAQIARGIDVIELDLRGTADREVVVMHDETVDRTTNGSGEVARMTLRQLKALDAGGYADRRFRGERIPTYAEVLELVNGILTDVPDVLLPLLSEREKRR
jgi:glycerophosphoryl diester phosphodiesterase